MTDPQRAACLITTINPRTQMRLLSSAILLLSVIPATLGGLFDDDTTTAGNRAAAPTGSTTSSSSGALGPGPINTPAVAFLLTLQTAQISSMSCLITLFNMTTQPIGTCLDLVDLAGLIVGTDLDGMPADQRSGAFSDQLSLYLGTACASAACTDADLVDASQQLEQNCGGQEVDLVRVLRAVLANYSTSYRTLACMVQFNGTTEDCLPSNLATSPITNTNTFFNNLVSANQLEQYTDSVFKAAQCTGCMYELYKAAIYTTSAIRGNPLKQDFGVHLETCPATGSIPNWPDVQDQQIPNSLQVSQNLNAGQSQGSGTYSGAALSSKLDWWRIWLGVMGLAMGRMSLAAMVDDPVDLCFS